MFTDSTMPPAPASVRDSVLTVLGQQLQKGALHLEFPDGTSHRFQAPQPGAEASIQIRHRRFVRRVLFGGDIGFAEAYIDGDCETPDIRAVVDLALANWDSWEKTLNGMATVRLLRRLSHLARPNSRRVAKRNIARHYDLGNAFYEKWLDPTLSYSSAVFSDKDEPLAAAQERKFRQIAELAGLAPGQHVLEIGCGWGGFALYAAKEIGCRVTAITISRQQHEFARRRIAEAGLAGRVDVRLQDYRDLDTRFDGVVSIEMFEAVGERYWPAFFAKLRDCLKPGARAALQVITIDDDIWDVYRRSTDFIQRYIFPGGMLPSPEAFRIAARSEGLTVAEQNSYGADYARTLDLWHDAFDAAWPAIAALGFDERFRRMWKYYLAYCEGGFRSGRIDLRQICLQAA
ncbi:MAG: cyclopropane-fatty-acyl-phospholipid synthase family protein [Alphaproteobacteria bacterium]|nr:cyclopropane-fatty-acyl-phospholipid synthase family protein [Alphaproteobacteria bacterium]